MKVLRKFIDNIKCFFGKHDWENIGQYEPPAGDPGTKTCYSSLHRCKHCSKEEFKGMGCINW